MAHNEFPMIIGLLYVLLGTVGVFVLLRGKRLGIITHISVLTVSALLGFGAFTPMFPVQFQQLVLGKGPDGKPVIAAIAVIALLLLSTFAVGRIFCGYLCPVGAVQELAYFLPSKKVHGRYGSIFTIVRIVFFAAIGGSAVFGGIALLDWIGITAFFHLRMTSPFFYLFAAVLVSSLFLYRPFCRTACPLGLLMSLTSRLSFFKMRTGASCTNCMVCEKQCPTQTAILTPDRAGECYLCLRCKEKCSRDAIVYQGRKA